MFGQKIAVIALSALGLVSAQSNFTISPDSVEIGRRASWCTAQQNNCDTICGAASANSCNPSTLDFKCTCASGDKPDLAEYKNTMPYYICQEAADQCNLRNVGDKDGQDACTTDIRDKCGKKDPSKASSSEPSTSAGGSTATPTGDSSPAATSGNSAPSSTPKDSAAAMPAGAQYLGLAVVGILAVMI
jgi:hypothetical protein